MINLSKLTPEQLARRQRFLSSTIEPKSSKTRLKVKKNNEKKLFRFACYAKVRRALKSGKLKKSPCVICKDKNVQAHHEDYSKPLDIVWLCKRHHIVVDDIRRIKESLTKI